MDEPTHQESQQLRTPRSITLPRDMHTAIAQALATAPAERWTRAAQALSDRYRAERSANERPLATERIEALGYAALILPAAYAQLRGAMSATAARVPGWAPATMLDLGSGPGTTLWAATTQWPSLRMLARFMPDHPIWGRVIREPASNKAYAEAKLSTRVGIVRYRALKRHREAFRHVQRLEWGTALTEPLPEPITPIPEQPLTESVKRET